jgi:fructan beta-fructosidase
VRWPRDRPGRRPVIFLALGLIISGCAVLGDGDGDPATGPEPFRPAFHFTPERNWMNDPNGPLYLDGRWHLFYQYNPEGDQWGVISWGHAVSDDLLHWDEQGVAIPAEDDLMIFSGSAVVDRADTSGLCDAAERCVVALYTGYRVEPAAPERAVQTQDLAYSTDGGDTWAQYAGNPVVDLDAPDFRDPNVTWHEPSQRWVMAVALPIERQVLFYGSADLRNWEPLSSFGPLGATDGIWECPVLLELPVDGDPDDTRWVLKVDHNPGHVTGGSGAQYFVGHFDGERFEVEGPDDGPRWLDHGPDFYCAMQFSGEPADDGRRTWIAWMSNWDYAADVPTGPWRGAMTLPQVVGLTRTDDTVRLVQHPLPGIDALRGEHRRVEGDPTTVADALATGDPAGDSFEANLRVEVGDADEVALRVRVGDDEETLVGYDASAGVVFLDRTRSGDVGFHPSFPGRYTAPLSADDGVVELRVFVDRSSVEVYDARGLAVITALIFPDPASEGIGLHTAGGPSGPIELDLWPLRDTR